MLKGGPAIPPTIPSSIFVLPWGDLLALFFALGGFLATLFTSCCLSCRSWLVCCASGGGFCSPGTCFSSLRDEFWNPLGYVFPGLLVHAHMQCEHGPRGVLYWKNQYETHVGHLALEAKNKEKSIPQPSETYTKAIQPANMRHFILENLQPRFLKGFRRLLPLLATSGALLGVSWALLDASLAVSGVLLAAFCPS